MSGSDPAYARLGLRRVVNAADTYTALGGGRLPDEVRAAMVAAAAHHVSVPALLAAVGDRLASLTRNPAALVVNGAAAGLAVAAAAVMAGDDPGRVDALPGRPGPRSEFVVLCCQRNPYDRAVLASGGTLVEVGYSDSTPSWQLAAALTERTAGVLWFAGDQFERYSPPLEEVAALAHAAGVPVIVDAAAQVPPVSNLWTYRERGGDLVLFSGGKGLRGPQASGLVVGSRSLIGACARNTYPYHSIGRAMKTSKENVLGLLAAVERSLALDWDAEYARWSGSLDGFAARLAEVPGVTQWRVPTGRLGQAYPRLFFCWTGGRTAAELAAALRDRDPAVEIGTGEGGERTAHLNPYSLLDGEAELVIEAVLDEL